MTLNQIIDYINNCSIYELDIIHHLAADRFHHLQYQNEHEKDERVKNSLSLGDQVSWASEKTMRRGKERIYGIVTRLNPKTATIATKEYGQWRVAYSFLKKEGSFTTSPTQESTVVEGEIINQKQTANESSSATEETVIHLGPPKDYTQKETSNKPKNNKSKKKSKKRKKKKGK